MRFDRGVEPSGVGLLIGLHLSVMVVGRGTVQSFLAMTRGRPVTEVRTHSIEWRAHQSSANAFFLLVGTERSSFPRWRPAACAYRMDVPITCQALCNTCQWKRAIYCTDARARPLKQSSFWRRALCKLHIPANITHSQIVEGEKPSRLYAVSRGLTPGL
jgi:hypothetical protein